MDIYFLITITCTTLEGFEIANEIEYVFLLNTYTCLLQKNFKILVIEP